MSILKKTSFLIIAALSVLTISITAFAADFPEKVRVGLSSNYANKESISISNSSLYIGLGAEDDFSESGTLFSNSGFTVQMPSGYYVDCKEYFDTYEDAEEVLGDYDDYGYDAYPTLIGEDEWTIFVCNISSASEAENIASAFGGKAITTTTSIIEIEGDFGLVLADGVYPQLGDADGGNVKLGSKSYRGVVEFGRYKNSFITAVNVLTIDEYLYSVVPSEMPYTWHEEALKAQIVAARSYTYTRLNAHSNDGYGLCDGSNCQVYNGVNSEKANVTELVDETSGILALYEDEPINAVYHSSSGGHTDNCENVWTAKVPYLRGVKELFDTKTKPWSRTFSSSELGSLCAKDGANIGSITSVDFTASTLTGRVQTMTFHGTNGSHTIKKDGIRSFFSSSGGYLSSRMFTLNGLGVTDYEGAVYTAEDVIILIAVSEDISSKYNTSGVFTIDGQKFALEGNYTPQTVTSNEDSLKTFTASGSSYNFSGYGSGHGIGMSQYGAKDMAENGYSYEEILKHYYTGIEVK